MHIKSLNIKSFKRFSNLTIDGLNETTKLVVLIGPNGSGKSSIFDAFKLWGSINGIPSGNYDEKYHHKYGSELVQSWNQKVNIEFHEELPPSNNEKKKLFHIRSAYRNDPDFTITNLSKVGSALDAPKIEKMIDTDRSVSDNYQRLVSNTVDSLFQVEEDEMTVRELREKLIGKVRESMNNIFDDLTLTSLGHPLKDGTFYFEKGESLDFHYKNLSAGEKSTFDLILDLIIKLTEFNDTVFCIDEPESHVHTKLQAKLIDELYSLIPDNSQLWVATHSIGIMRKAKELQDSFPETVELLDFSEQNFDEEVKLKPVEINRNFWLSTLSIALDDLADLIAPSRVVICEGQPLSSGARKNPEFDANCFKNIFNSVYDTDFVSMGNSIEVINDSKYVGRAIQTLISGTDVIKLVDKDARSEVEVKELNSNGVKVLSRRTIENYLIDDEVIEKFCKIKNAEDKISDAIQIKMDAIQSSVGRGNPPDDLKSAVGEFYVNLTFLLNLTNHGNNWQTFLRDTISPIITPDMLIYQELYSDIFE